ncbi:hypothetical protein C2R22_24315 (plasmid) [Salinigranum rubrum]|uniref:DUF1468 domain-containing protein n=1 Tax=Salinigranum rubrum TaxID=755307 RepID=A0A2I8VRZ3_9EURY|nr:tripartite tricarboxylate transporter TctB family protein [Salinigranum rubrum]AUV84656.1 hypothetical protein C2R22_24315 [Salinigranum rubrum]
MINIDMVHTSIAVRDELSSVLFIALGIAIVYVSSSFPSGTTRAPGAGFFPQLLGIAIVVLASIDIVTRRKFEADSHQQIELADAKTFLTVVGLFAAYIFVIPLIGFIISTAIYLYLIAAYSGVTFKRRVLITIVTPVVLHYLFSEFLSLPLPEIPFLANLLS